MQKHQLRRRVEFVNFVFSLTLAVCLLCHSAFARPLQDDLADAMQDARTRHYNDALSILERLHQENPNDPAITRDYIIVLDWTHYDDQAITLYEQMGSSDQPDAVLLAAANAYYMTGQKGKALSIYRLGYDKYPNDPAFNDGIKKCSDVLNLQTLDKKIPSHDQKTKSLISTPKPKGKSAARPQHRTIASDKTTQVQPLSAATASTKDNAEQTALLHDLTSNKNVSNDQIDHAQALLDHQDYAGATFAIKQLAQTYPQNGDVKDLIRQLAVYNMAELDVSAFFNPRSTNNVTGGQGYGVDTTLYSAPIDYKWRLFAGDSYAHEKETIGQTDYNQSRAGIEYRGINLTATAAPTYNLYNNGERTGFLTTGEWRFNDTWSAGGAYELFSRDTPLQALNAGITSNKLGMNAEWKQGDLRVVRFDGNDIKFSDGDNRLDGEVLYLENLYANAKWRLDSLIDTSLSHNSADENRAYYNPKTDFAGFLGPKITQTLYRQENILYTHSLSLSPGAYWQQGFGTTPAAAATYTQSVNFDQALEGRASVNYVHQSFDGQINDDFGITLSLIKHF